MRNLTIHTPSKPMHKSYNDITVELSRFTESGAGKGWYAGITISMIACLIGIGCAFQTAYSGIGTWGLNTSVGWGTDITNFVWWIGLGHAGTFISAILLILNKGWRTSINRAAEAMTIFSVICAAFFPLIHLGRPDHVFYSLPYPNMRNLWVNFNSPLIWDVFAIGTYFIVSVIYWFIGLIPDLATLRDRTTSRSRHLFYKVLSMGWTGRSRDWNLHRNASYLLALIAVPLVISVHSIVSLDFATSILPGWHSTIFPAYFVVGAIFSGFALVQALLIVTRKVMKLEEYITMNHIQKVNKIILLTGSILLLAYFTETFFSLYSGDVYERTLLKEKLSGTYSPLFYAMILTNGLLPQLLWIRKFRSNIMVTSVIALLILAGMWIERFMIIVVTLHRDFIPARWADYVPSLTEAGLFLGSLGFFFTSYFLFAKYFPIISIAEIKHSMHITEDNGNYTQPL